MHAARTRARTHAPARTRAHARTRARKWGASAARAGLNRQGGPATLWGIKNRSTEVTDLIMGSLTSYVRSDWRLGLRAMAFQLRFKGSH